MARAIRNPGSRPTARGQFWLDHLRVSRARADAEGVRASPWAVGQLTVHRALGTQTRRGAERGDRHQLSVHLEIGGHFASAHSPTTQPAQTHTIRTGGLRRRLTLQVLVRRYESELNERDAVIAKHESALAHREAMMEQGYKNRCDCSWRAGLRRRRRSSPTDNWACPTRPRPRRGRGARERTGRQGRCPSARHAETSVIARVPAARRHRASVAGSRARLSASRSGARALRRGGE